MADKFLRRFTARGEEVLSLTSLRSVQAVRTSSKSNVRLSVPFCEDNGDLIISPIADASSLEKMGVKVNEPVKVGNFNGDQKHFLDYHREEILLKAAM